MLGNEKMARLNSLAKKKKESGLTPEETKEQEALRQEYLAEFRKNFRQRLENIEVEYVD